MIKDIQFKPKVRNSNSPDHSEKKQSKFLNVFQRRGSIDHSSESLQTLQQPRKKDSMMRKI